MTTGMPGRSGRFPLPPGAGDASSTFESIGAVIDDAAGWRAGTGVEDVRDGA
jgi:hypothetical protein